MVSDLVGRRFGDSLRNSPSYFTHALVNICDPLGWARSVIFPSPTHQGNLMPRLIVILSLFAFVISSAAIARPSQLPVPRVAPEWKVSEWFNSPALSLADLKGKVVVIDFFQLW